MAESLRILGVGDAKSRHFARWATRLAERGHEVHIASGRVNPREGELDGLIVHQFQDLDPLLKMPLVRRYRMAPALTRLAQRVQPDVVHSHYLLPYGYWTARAGLGPLVVSPWGKDAIVDAWNSPEAEERARVAIAPDRALAYVVNSQALEDAAVRLGADRAKFHRIFWHARIDGYSPEHADRGRWRRSAGRTTRSSASRCATSGPTRISTSFCARSPRREQRCRSSASSRAPAAAGRARSSTASHESSESSRTWPCGTSRPRSFRR